MIEGTKKYHLNRQMNDDNEYEDPMYLEDAGFPVLGRRVVDLQHIAKVSILLYYVAYMYQPISLHGFDDISHYI